VPHACADGDDMAHALMARDERRLGLNGQSPSAAWRSVWQTPVAAILTRICRAGRRHGDFFDRQRLAELMDDGCHHAFGH
jgi:hypothetical protein